MQRATPAGVSFIDLQIGVAANGVDPGHACGVTSSGAMYCWGSNGLGQLGLGTVDLDPHPTPTLVPLLPAVTKIAVNGNAVCALTALGERYCWGYNTSSGQLGKGDNQNAFSPVRVP